MLNGKGERKSARGGRVAMTKPTFWIWLLSTPVLAGVFITVLLLIPSLAPSLGRWIVGACALSALLTVPFSFSVGKFLTAGGPT
jgi:hypothetical protein